MTEIENTQVRLDEARELRQSASAQVASIRNHIEMIERETRDAERKQQTLESERGSSEARLAEAAAADWCDRGRNCRALPSNWRRLQARRAEAQTQLEVSARTAKTNSRRN